MNIKQDNFCSYCKNLLNIHLFSVNRLKILLLCWLSFYVSVSLINDNICAVVSFAFVREHKTKWYLTIRIENNIYSQFIKNKFFIIVAARTDSPFKIYVEYTLLHDNVTY